MIPWEILDTASVPGDTEELTLYRRDDEYSIRLKSCELMNSRVHGSEEALAELTCARLGTRPNARILIGGLGIGFSVRAALDMLGSASKVVVAELVPKVVEWNRTYLAHLAQSPLKDRRVTVREVNVADIIRAESESFNAIILDVDNGPEGLTRQGNNWLYTSAGLEAAHEALISGGVLSVWSSSRNKPFVKRFRKAGFTVDEESVYSRGHKGSRHTIFLGKKG